LISAVALGTLGGCERRTNAERHSPPKASSAVAARQSAKPPVPAASLREPSPAASPKPRPVEDDRVLGQSLRAAPDAGVDPALGILPGPVSEIGPAAPMTASADGVVFVTKSGEVVVARRKAMKQGGVEPLARDASEFAAFGRGPSLVGDSAYFVRDSRIEARKIGVEAPLRVLADKVQVGSRASALEIEPGKVAVAYLSTPDSEGTSRAMLFYDGSVQPLTPEGAGASSVALLKSGADFIAVSIDGRSGMTPLHARRVGVGKSGLTLQPDQVVWVGASAQVTTEVVVGSDGKKPWAFLAIEKDSTHFGLAELLLPTPHEIDAKVSWLLFENGIDIAPVAAAVLCGRLYVAFVRPQTNEPHPQELVLSEVGTPTAAVVAEARAFIAVSLAGRDQGGLLSFVADRTTLALDLFCRK
jgi:hypothetical protein